MNEESKWCSWRTASIIAYLILHRVSHPVLHRITGGFPRSCQDHLARVSLPRRNRSSLAIDAQHARQSPKHLWAML